MFVACCTHTVLVLSSSGIDLLVGISWTVVESKPVAYGKAALGSKNLNLNVSSTIPRPPVKSDDSNDSDDSANYWVNIILRTLGLSTPFHSLL